ncbi:hypothetical protein [Moraxella sp. ZY210820]|nr:hypothetical protein [Moraxella sp. ZY210820]WLF84669.1 hypothetical protein LU301_04130 [Moraxella sp. ZY210820]
MILQDAQRQLQLFFTIPREVSKQAIDFSKKINYNLQNHTMPAFEKNLNSKSFFHQPLESRLFELEQSISVYLLQEISYALRHLAKTKDDYTYFYLCTRLFFTNLIVHYNNICNQSTFKLNHQVQNFMNRLLAWNAITEKRHHEIFLYYHDNEYQLQNQKAEKVIYDLFKILETGIEQEIKLQKELQHLYAQEHEIDSMFWLKRIFIKKPNFTRLISETLNKIYKIKQKIYSDIMMMKDIHPSTMLYIEEEQMSLSSNSHHLYALNMGENGFSRLPILIQLPKDIKLFDMRQVQNNLVNDYNLLNQQWFPITQQDTSIEHNY